MDKIQKQGSRIAELIDKGREQGYLTYADVNDHLPEDISDPDQVDEIIGMINDLGLQVHETAPDADTLMLSESSDDDDGCRAAHSVGFATALRGCRRAQRAGPASRWH